MHYVHDTNAEAGFRFCFVSPAVTQLLGYTVDEALGLSIREILVPESFDKAARTIQAKLASGILATEPYLLWVRHKSGAVIPVEVSSNIYKDANGAFIQGVARDASKNNLLLRAMEASRLAYYYTDPDGLTLWATPLERELLGRETALVCNRRDLYVFPDDREELLEDLGRGALSVDHSEGLAAEYHVLTDYTCLFYRGQSRADRFLVTTSTREFVRPGPQQRLIGVEGIYREGSPLWPDDGTPRILMRLEDGPNGRSTSIVLANAAFLHLFEVEPEWSPDRSTADVFDESTAGLIDSAVSALVDGQVGTMELGPAFVSVRTSAPRERLVETAVRRLNPCSQRYYVVAFRHDPHRDEKLLLEEQRKCIMQDSRDCFCVYQADGAVVWANESFSELFGWSPAATLNILDLAATPTEREKLQHELENRLNGTPARNVYEFLGRTHAGQKRRFGISSTLIKVLNKKRVFCILTDVAEKCIISQALALNGYNENLRSTYAGLEAIVHDLLGCDGLFIHDIVDATRRLALQVALGDASVSDVAKRVIAADHCPFASVDVAHAFEADSVLCSRHDCSVRTEVERRLGSPRQWLQLPLYDVRDQVRGLLCGFMPKGHELPSLAPDTWRLFAQSVAETLKSAIQKEAVALVRGLSKDAQKSTTPQTVVEELQALVACICDHFSIGAGYVLTSSDNGSSFRLAYSSRTRSPGDERTTFPAALHTLSLVLGTTKRRVFLPDEATQVYKDLPFTGFKRAVSHLCVPLRSSNQRVMGVLILQGPRNRGERHSDIVDSADMCILREARPLIESRIEHAAMQEREIANMAVTSHNIKVPLQYMHSTFSSMRYRLDPARSTVVQYDGPETRAIVERDLAELKSHMEVLRLHTRTADFFKMLEHGGELERSVGLNLSQITRHVISFFQPMAKLDRDLTIRSLDDGFDYVVFGNEAALEVLVQNLLDNAIKYSFKRAANQIGFIRDPGR